MVKYAKCPRCELNYIDEDKQEYCDICLAEMRGAKLKFADIDEEEDLEHLELCPVCNTNYIRFGEKMCESCKKLSEYEQDDVIDVEQDEEWRNYIDDETEDLDIPEEEFIDEEDADLDEEEEDEFDIAEDPDDFDFPSSGDYNYDDDDEDDEDEDEDDDF